jgi:hypothetical protein
MSRLRTLEGNMVAFYCPGCGESHAIDRTRWTVDIESETISPSVLLHENWRMPKDWDYEKAPKDENGELLKQENGKILGAIKSYRCHSFVRNGKIQYLNDCTHELAGKTVDMEKI